MMGRKVVRIFSALLVGAVLLGSSPLPAFAAGPNLVSNPSLETGAGTPDMWTATYWGNVTPTFQYPVPGHTGNGAGITLNANTSGDARWAHDPIPVEAGVTYEYSNWYASNVATEINVLYMYTDGHVSYGWVASPASSANAWKQFSTTLKIPTGVSSVVLFHLIDRKGTLAVDDFILAKQSGGSVPNKPTVTLSANPTAVSAGSSSTLSWNSQYADTCVASGGWTGNKSVTGNEIVTPTVNTSYTLACTGAGGTTSVSTSVTVNTVQPPPPTPGQFSEGMVTLSFDDAWTSQYTNALPILNQAGIKGTFYILSEPVQGGWSSYMTPQQVKTIAQQGHEIGGHTVTHADLSTLSSSRIDREIKNSKTYLQNLLGTAVTTLAYPYGSYNTTVINRTKLAGYGNARTADPTIAYGFNAATQPKYEINSFSPNKNVSVASIKSAIDQAKANKQWFVFSVHEVLPSGGDEYSMTTAQFKEVVEYIKATGIKTVTIAQGAALLPN